MPLSPRHQASFVNVVVSSALVGIATAGTLIGIGRRTGEASRVFRLVGINVLGAAGVTGGVAPLPAIVAGNVHHALIATAWGVLMSLIVLRLRGVTRITVCVVLPAVYGVMAPRLVPPVLRIGHAVTSSPADLLPIAATMAVALLGGVWVARRQSVADRDT